MKTNFKKIVSTLALAATFAALPLAGCAGGGTGGTKELPKDKTIIRLLCYDAGYGRTYVEKVAREFEKVQAEHSYETGKKGVYFDITQSPTAAVGDEVLTGLPNSDVDMFFSNGHTAAELKKNGYVMDLTKLVKASSKDETPISPFAGETSIYDRMYDDYRDYVTTAEGEVYNIPLFMMTYNLTYDVDLMKENKLYIRKDSTDTKINLTGDVAQASAGVDGVAGTEDDGLPETYAQFLLWMEKMTNNTTPIHYQGGMLMRAMSNFWADFEGKEGTKACYTFDGTKLTDLVDKVNDDGSVTYLPETAITPENGYLVQRQEGRLRVLQLMEKLAASMKTSDGYIYKKKFPSVDNHKQAQTTYLVSSQNDTKPILMFAEGGYWETEAAATFNKMGGNTKRNFAILPTPKYSREDVGVDSRRTVWSEFGGEIFLRKGVEGQVNEQAVTDFFLYYNSEENMAIQNREASQPRPFEYSIDSIKDTMSNYQISLYNMLHNDRTDVVFAGDSNDFTIANKDQINNYYWLLYSSYDVNSDEAAYTPVQIMYERDATAKTFFEGLERVYTKKVGGQSKWDEMLGRVSK